VRFVLQDTPRYQEPRCWLRGPSPADTRWHGLLVCAIDGTIMTVADSTANLAACSKHQGGAVGGSGYPQLRLLALVSCGTRTVIDAVFGPCSSGETTPWVPSRSSARRARTPSPGTVIPKSLELRSLAARAARLVNALKASACV
jgi:hypothetical protein